MNFLHRCDVQFPTPVTKKEIFFHIFQFKMRKCVPFAVLFFKIKFCDTDAQ